MKSLKKVVFIVLLGVLLAGNSAYATVIQSVRDGIWSDPSMWNPTQVPGSNDDVTINPDHDVALACGSASAIVDVNSLVISVGATISPRPFSDTRGEAHMLPRYAMRRRWLYLPSLIIQQAASLLHNRQRFCPCCLFFCIRSPGVCRP